MSIQVSVVDYPARVAADTATSRGRPATQAGVERPVGTRLLVPAHVHTDATSLLAQAVHSSPMVTGPAGMGPAGTGLGSNRRFGNDYLRRHRGCGAENTLNKNNARIICVMLSNVWIRVLC